MQKKIKNLFKFSLGILILGTLFYKIGFNEIIETLKTVDIYWLILSIPVLISTFVIAACKFILLLKRLGYDLSFSRIFRYSFLGWALGTITPGKVGEFSLVYFLKNEGVGIGKGTAVTILDKLTTLTAYFLITVVGIAYFFTLNDLLKVGIMLMLFLGTVSFAIISQKSRGLIKRFILRKYSEKFRGFSKTFFYFLKKEKAVLVLGFGITLCKHIVNTCLPFIYFLSLNVHIPYSQIFLITGIIMGLSIIPITVSGLGIKETASVFMYGYIAGIPASIVASSCVLALIVKYSTAAIGAMILWQKIEEGDK